MNRPDRWLGFLGRLRDLLATLEASAVSAGAGARARGLGEQLRFACAALPCSEAFAAVEVRALGRLQVPVIAAEDGWRPVDLEFFPTGTPFAYLIAGGSGHAVELMPDDPLIAPVRAVLGRAPAAGIFVPIRIGGEPIGGAALLSERPLAVRELAMAEQLADVLALTLESYRTERLLFELFARALPELLSADAPTSLPDTLRRFLFALRADAGWERHLEIAALAGRVASRGGAEAELVVDVLRRLEAYAARAEQQPGELP